MENKDHLSDNDYITKVYAGILGKVIGVRHGADIEGLTYDQIQMKYGEIHSYIRNYQKNFAADDDTNGFTFFIRAIDDFNHVSPREMGLTWLNYIPDRHGFLWWGGYGISAEQTAYENLSNGIEAPLSGSSKQNGLVLAEQIGGQIFSDIWGLVCPGEPQAAADLARKMSSVSHDGEAVNGGSFIAACTASAFQEKDIFRILQQGLSVIPNESEYSLVIQKVIQFYRLNPEDWRKCFHYIRENYGYDHYPGPVPIIPNAAIVVLALLYGEGDFSKTINISNMCGWDTDCNTGNAATIISVRNGLDGINSSWREPVHDLLVCSSVLGSLNIVDIPNFALYVARLSYRLNGRFPTEKWKRLFEVKNNTYHFELEGSTHSFQNECDQSYSKALMENTTESSYTGNRSLKINWNNITKNSSYRTYLKTYYSPLDFDDSRMDPAFSPIMYPGQTLTATIQLGENHKESTEARLFVYDKNKQVYLYGEHHIVNVNWTQLRFEVPFLDSACIEKAGIELSGTDGSQSQLTYYIDSFIIGGKAAYSILFKNEKVEKWNSVHQEISQMTSLRGIWTLEKGALYGRFNGLPAESYTGNYHWKDYVFSTIIIPEKGDDHLILFRVQGGIKSYAFGLGLNSIIFYKKDEKGYHPEVTYPFVWVLGEPVELSVKAYGNQFEFWVNKQHLFNYVDITAPYLNGAIGFANMNASITAFVAYEFKEL